MPAAARRTWGNARRQITEVTGQPIKKAESQRRTKSARKPILANLTTQLTTKTNLARKGVQDQGPWHACRHG